MKLKILDSGKFVNVGNTLTYVNGYVHIGIVVPIIEWSRKYAYSNNNSSMHIHMATSKNVRCLLKKVEDKVKFFIKKFLKN